MPKCYIIDHVFVWQSSIESSLDDFLPFFERRCSCSSSFFAINSIHARQTAGIFHASHSLSLVHSVSQKNQAVFEIFLRKKKQTFFDAHITHFSWHIPKKRVPTEISLICKSVFGSVRKSAIKAAFSGLLFSQLWPRTRPRGKNYVYSSL